MPRTESPRLTVLTVALASVFASALAQAQRPRADAGAASPEAGAALRSTAANEMANSFNRTTQSGNEGASLGSGAGPSQAAGPQGELRGPTEPTPDQITGPITAADAARIVRAMMPQLQPCYETARHANPRLSGRLELRFTIARDGRVSRAQAYGMPEAPDVATCLAGVLQRTHFPRPEGGDLQLFYPVTFEPPAPPPRPAGRRGAPTAPRH